MALLERIVSSPSNVFMAATRQVAVQNAIIGVGTNPVSVPRDKVWPTLQRYINDNAGFVTYNPSPAQDPEFIWDSSATDGQSLGFAVSSNEYSFSTSINFDISVVAFADNAHNLQIDLVDATSNTVISTLPLGLQLDDGSMDPATGVTVETTDFPYNWQNIRFYSISTGALPAGTYKIIVSFTAVNYDQFPGFPNPAAVAFVADIFFSPPLPPVFNETQGTFFATINDAVTAANNNDTLLILPGTINQSTIANINKPLTIRGLEGSTILATSNLTPAIRISASNVTLEGLTITTDMHRNNWEFIEVSGNNNQIINNTIFAPALPPPSSAWPTTRGIVSVLGGTNNLLVQGNTIHSIRTGMYLNPGTNGQVLDNVIFNTRGGILVEGNEPTQPTTFLIQGNSWGTPANFFDIVLLLGTNCGPPYDPLANLSANNDNALISDQRVPACPQ
jgi:hypothetical protein